MTIRLSRDHLVIGGLFIFFIAKRDLLILSRLISILGTISKKERVIIEFQRQVRRFELSCGYC